MEIEDAMEEILLMPTNGSMTSTSLMKLALSIEQEDGTMDWTVLQRPYVNNATQMVNHVLYQTGIMSIQYQNMETPLGRRICCKKSIREVLLLVPWE